MKLSSKPKSGIDVSLPPSVNFVPSKYADHEMDGIIHRRLFYTVTSVLALCALAYLGATVTSFSADVFLKNSQLRLEEVRSKEELFKGVANEESHIQYLESARIVGGAAGVAWKSLLEQIVATYPENTRTNAIEVLPIGNSLVGSSAAKPKDALEQVNLFLIMKDYSSVQTWMDRLKQIPGFSDSKLSSITATADGYELKLAVYFNAQVLAKQYLTPIQIGAEGN
jgi:Tfp pilus assembly protein PilN